MRLWSSILVCAGLVAGCVTGETEEPAGEEAVKKEAARPAVEEGEAKPEPDAAKAPPGDKPRLPQGDAGIAAKHPGDAGIEKDEAVVFVENFESASPDDLKSRWNGVKNRPIMSYVDDVPAGSGGKKSLLMTFVGGKGSGGHLYKSFKEGLEKVHLRFYTKFDPKCYPIHHFVHMGGYNPPTPWPQGGAGNRPDGAKRVSTAVEPFEGFRWRSSKQLKMNYLWILLYITKAPAGHVSKVFFDDIVLATEYIGPIKRAE